MMPQPQRPPAAAPAAAPAAEDEGDLPPPLLAAALSRAAPPNKRWRTALVVGLRGASRSLRAIAASCVDHRDGMVYAIEPSEGRAASEAHTLLAEGQLDRCAAAAAAPGADCFSSPPPPLPLLGLTAFHPRRRRRAPTLLRLAG
jgi:hypothetical protein